MDMCFEAGIILDEQYLHSDEILYDIDMHWKVQIETIQSEEHIMRCPF